MLIRLLAVLGVDLSVRKASSCSFGTRAAHIIALYIARAESKDAVPSNGTRSKDAASRTVAHQLRSTAVRRRQRSQESPGSSSK
jgi:hypothetical protein